MTVEDLMRFINKTPRILKRIKGEWITKIDGIVLSKKEINYLIRNKCVYGVIPIIYKYEKELILHIKYNGRIGVIKIYTHK